jgi:hypothetical protein
MRYHHGGELAKQPQSIAALIEAGPRFGGVLSNPGAIHRAGRCVPLAPLPATTTEGGGHSLQRGFSPPLPSEYQRQPFVSSMSSTSTERPHTEHTVLPDDS